MLWERKQRTKRSRNSDFKFIWVFSSKIDTEQVRDQEWEYLENSGVIHP